MMQRTRSASKYTRLIAAFAAVYLIWGSTYLGIRIAVETLPPFLMAAARFLLAGTLLYSWAAVRGATWPGWQAWARTGVIGALLLLGGNGGATWAEQHVPSALAALLVAVEPLWIVILEWLRPRGQRPGWRAAAGVVVGVAGVALLVGPGSLASAGTVHHAGVAVIVLAALAWAVGSLYSRDAKLPRSGAQTAGMQMLMGGSMLALVSLLSGELASFDAARVSLRSLAAFGYLTVFGSIVAFSAYTWLMRHTTATRASTYAFVNPAVAVFLGWAILGEPITPTTLVATTIIIGAVVLITFAKSPPAQRSTVEHPPRVRTVAAEQRGTA